MHKFIRGWRSGMRYYVPELDMWVSSCTLTRVLAAKLNYLIKQNEVSLNPILLCNVR